MNSIKKNISHKWRIYDMKNTESHNLEKVSNQLKVNWKTYKIKLYTMTSIQVKKNLKCSHFRHIRAFIMCW